MDPKSKLKIAESDTVTDQKCGDVHLLGHVCL